MASPEKSVKPGSRVHTPRASPGGTGSFASQHTAQRFLSGGDDEHSFPSDSSAAGSFAVDFDPGLSLTDVSSTAYVPTPSEVAYVAPEPRVRWRCCEWHRSTPFMWSAATLGALLLVAAAARIILACFHPKSQRYL